MGPRERSLFVGCEASSQKSRSHSAWAVSIPIDPGSEALKLFPELVHALPGFFTILLTSLLVIYAVIAKGLEHQPSACCNHDNHRHQAPQTCWPETEEQTLQNGRSDRCRGGPYQKPAQFSHHIGKEQGNSESEGNHEQPKSLTYSEVEETAKERTRSPLKASTPGQAKSRAGPHHHLTGEQEDTSSEKSPADKEEKKVLTRLATHDGRLLLSGIMNNGSGFVNLSKPFPAFASMAWSD